MNARLVFAGTGAFAVPALRALTAAGCQVALVVAAPDRPAGRGRKLGVSPVKATALELGLTIAQPVSLRDPAQWDAVRAANAEYLVVADYGLILPAGLLDLPARGALNIHASLLPRWRGAAPVARALLAGDTLTGISIIQMDAGVDTGPVLYTRAVPVLPGECAGPLEERLAHVGAGALLEVLTQLAEGGGQVVTQTASGACYAHKLRPQESTLDWRQPAVVLERQVRALNPRPGAHALWGRKRLRVWGASVMSGTGSGLPGAIRGAETGELIVATGEEWLRLDVVQGEGGRPMPAADFLRGHPLAPGLSFTLPEPHAAT